MDRDFLLNFSRYKGRLGVSDYKTSIDNWLNNFKHIGFNNKLILSILLNNIRIISDNDIVNSFNDFVFNSGLSYKKIITTSFGVEGESSYRIISGLDKLKMPPNIHEVLYKIDNSKNYNALICFVDDFLVSGGQFISVIGSLFSNNKNRSELNLSDKEIDIFRRTNKIFFFYEGTEFGISKANKTLQYYKLEENSIIEVKNKFIIDKTLFGKIINNKINDIKETIFFNYATKREIESFYETRPIQLQYF